MVGIGSEPEGDPDDVVEEWSEGRRETGLRSSLEGLTFRRKDQILGDTEGGKHPRERDT